VSAGIAASGVLLAGTAMAQTTLPSRLNAVLGDGDKPAVELLVVLAALALAALASAVSWAIRMSRLPPPGPRVQRLYLGIRFRHAARAVSPRGRVTSRVVATPAGAEGRARMETGHLLAVDLRSATIVSPRFAGKGDRLTLRLDSLPGFPAGDAGPIEVDAEVAGYRMLDGRPETYLLQLKLPLAPGAHQAPLLSYLEALAGRTNGASS
jgi:hypothetical protein